MLASAFAFSVMSLFVKVAGQRLPSQEIILARALVSLILSYGHLRLAGLSVWGNNYKLLVGRGIVGFLALSCFFYSLTHLPIAEATVIQYVYPVFTALLARYSLGERLGRVKLAFSLLSLVGVILIAQPAVLFGGSAARLNPLTVAIALGGAVFTAAAYVLVRRLSATEHTLVIIFYFPLIAVPASLPAVAPVAMWPQGWEWLALLGVGVLTQAGQIFLTRGLQRETAGRATSISYMQIVFATAWGALFYAEYPNLWSIVGSVLVVAGTLMVARPGRAATR